MAQGNDMMAGSGAGGNAQIGGGNGAMMTQPQGAMFDPNAGSGTGFGAGFGGKFGGAGGAGGLGAFLAQPALRRALPAIGALGALAAVGLLYSTLTTGPQRILYSSLTDGERANVVTTLESGDVSYEIDNATGMVTVGEDDLYRARMLVASDGSVAAPETSTDILSSIPMGASRTLEGERLRHARERELMQTIAEIDGVESVRVHLATPQRSAFVRDNVPPSASVMLRLARGRNISQDQVRAIINLVAGSVPGLNADLVRVVDQQGRLLSARPTGELQLLQLQADYESKLRAQIDKLLVPMLGEGNFSSEVQVDLEMDEVTRARESYDKEGAVRSEREIRSNAAAGRMGNGAGIPGATANTPPPETQIENAAPQGGPVGGAAGGAAGQAGGQREGQAGGPSESNTSRIYELGREVAVTSSRPGSIARLSVAVALSEGALEKIKPATAEQVQNLVSAAVGANTDRGDQVTVIAGTFEPVVEAEMPFYETTWFASIMRNAVTLIAVLLGLFMGVRPLVRAVTGEKKPKKKKGKKAKKGKKSKGKGKNGDDDGDDDGDDGDDDGDDDADDNENANNADQAQGANQNANQGTNQVAGQDATSDLRGLTSSALASENNLGGMAPLGAGSEFGNQDGASQLGALSAMPNLEPSANQEILREQVELARQLAAQQPDRAVSALRRMLAEPLEALGPEAARGTEQNPGQDADQTNADEREIEEAL